MLPSSVCLVLGSALGTQDSPSCSASLYPINLSNVQLMGGDSAVFTNGSAALCLQACCDSPSCTAWNYHVSSTDPSHHPGMCWLSNQSYPTARAGEKSDVWQGGSKREWVPSSGGGGGGGASIQPLSSWFYYSKTAPDTLLRELTRQSVQLLRHRSATVTAIKTKADWSARVKQAQQVVCFG